MTFEDHTTQPTTKKPFYKRWWFITISVILALFLAFAAWVAIEIKHIRDVEAQMKEDCKEQVTERAKYPGGVKFVTVEMTQGEEVESTDLRRMVHGWVDFPNGFGTPVRHSFFCGADYNLEDFPEMSVKVIPNK